MKSTDIAYAAGLFDGEGTVSIAKDKLSVSVAISGNHRLMHEWLKTTFGGSITKGGPVHLAGDVLSDGRTVRRDGVQEWKWRLYGQQALDFMEQIHPYLIEKRKQVAVVVLYRYLWPAKPPKVMNSYQRFARELVRLQLLLYRAQAYGGTLANSQQLTG